MVHKSESRFKSDSEWYTHLWKFCKCYFQKDKYQPDKEIIAQNLTKFDTHILSESEKISFETLYNYLNLKLTNTITYNDLNNLFYSLFCSLSALPENLKNLVLTKCVLALTFAKLALKKEVTDFSIRSNSKLTSYNDITDANHWMEQITIRMLTEDDPNHKNAKNLIGTK